MPKQGTIICSTSTHAWFVATELTRPKSS